MHKNPSLLGPASGAFDSFLKSVEAVDDKTVHFTFNTKYTPGLFSIVGQFIVPQHIWKDVADPNMFQKTRILLQPARTPRSPRSARSSIRSPGIHTTGRRSRSRA